MPTGNFIIGNTTLTTSELEIIRLAMQGKSRKEMADARHTKPTTIDSQMRILYLKLGVQKIGELIIWGFRHHVDRIRNFGRRKKK